MGVLGAANNSLISGVLVLRGQDHKAVVEVAPDWESYEYKKLDIYGDEEDKKFFEAALAWDLTVDGKTWADGKNVRTPFMTVMTFLTLIFQPSTSKRRAINDRSGVTLGDCSLYDGLLRLWIQRSHVSVMTNT